jgi:cystathionine gamma-lyase
VKDADLGKRIAFVQNANGGTPGPFDSWLTLRGVKTLAVRMERHCQNALTIATWLQQHPRVKQVIYPGLPNFAQRDLAAKQFRQQNGQILGGGMITVILDGELAHARTFLSTVRAFTLAESLGGVESLIEHPAIMTHASIPPEQRRAIGISDSLCRLSVGIEHVSDLQADLDHALKVAFT